MSEQTASVCERCGAFGDMPHAWVESDCVLPHKGHSRKLLEGTFVCVPCVDRWDEWLVEVLELWAGLTDVLLAGSVEEAWSEYQKPRKAPASPSPLRLAAWAMLHGRVNDHTVDQDGTEHAAYLGANLPDVPAVLSGWAQACFDAQHWTTTAPDTVSGATAVLRAARTTLAAIPDVDTFDAELRWVRRSLRNAHGITNPTPLGECLSVGCGGNVWPAGTSNPRCDRCGRHYGTTDVVRLKMNERQAS